MAAPVAVETAWMIEARLGADAKATFVDSVDDAGRFARGPLRVVVGLARSMMNAESSPPSLAHPHFSVGF